MGAACARRKAPAPEATPFWEEIEKKKAEQVEVEEKRADFGCFEGS